MMHQDNVSDLITFIIILTKQLLEISARDFKLQHNVSWSETVWLSDIWGEDVRWVITGFPSWRRGFKSFVKPNNLFSKPNQVTLVLLFWRMLHICKCWLDRGKWACCCHAGEAKHDGDAADRSERRRVDRSVWRLEVYCTLSSAVMKRTLSS